jgi:hypothetical protein
MRRFAQIAVSMLIGFAALPAVAAIRALAFLSSARRDGVCLWSGPDPRFAVWYRIFWERQGAYALVGVVAAVLAYSLCDWLMSPATNHETRCRKCGYILRGITEPRCSECGERI